MSHDAIVRDLGCVPLASLCLCPVAVSGSTDRSSDAYEHRLGENNRIGEAGEREVGV